MLDEIVSTAAVNTNEEVQGSSSDAQGAGAATTESRLTDRDIQVTKNSIKLRDKSILFSAISHVVYNVDPDEGNDISGAATITYNCGVDTNSITGLELYNTVNVAFAEDARDKATEFWKLVDKEQRFAHTQTNVSFDKFKMAFYAD